MKVGKKNFKDPKFYNIRMYLLTAFCFSLKMLVYLAFFKSFLLFHFQHVGLFCFLFNPPSDVHCRKIVHIQADLEFHV